MPFEAMMVDESYWHDTSVWLQIDFALYIERLYIVLRVPSCGASVSILRYYSIYKNINLLGKIK